MLNGDIPIFPEFLNWRSGGVGLRPLDIYTFMNIFYLFFFEFYIFSLTMFKGLRPWAKPMASSHGPAPCSCSCSQALEQPCLSAPKLQTRAREYYVCTARKRHLKFMMVNSWPRLDHLAIDTLPFPRKTSVHVRDSPGEENQALRRTSHVESCHASKAGFQDPES